MIVVVIAIGFWVLGWALHVPKHLRFGMIALLWAAVVIIHLTLPDGHNLRMITGGDARVWASVGVLVAVLGIYRAGLNWLRAQAKPVALPETGAMREAELDRYMRHIVLREIGGQGQMRLKSARVLVIGAGGLGAPSLMYLAAAGVGTIGVVDDDLVEGSNLQRQIIHTDARIGLPKVQSAEIAMRALNPFITVLPYHRRLDQDSLALIDDYDLILDGSDNFDTRYLVNAACVTAGKPLISAAITQWEGQISLYHPSQGGPCFACLFPERPATGLAPSCAEAGVMAALPGVIGSMMAGEAIKYLTGAGQGLMGRLMIYDALYSETRLITVPRNPDCPTCGQITAASRAP
jgi:molybdopterin/thiamine biosynthesis adenylyltransferase